MKTKIEITEDMREFNLEIEDADDLLNHYGFALAGEVGIRATVAKLRSLNQFGTANGLQAAAQAVGYTFPVTEVKL